MANKDDNPLDFFNGKNPLNFGTTTRNSGENKLDFFGGKNPLDFGTRTKNSTENSLNFFKDTNPLDFFSGRDPLNFFNGKNSPDFNGERKVYGGTNYEHAELRVNDYSVYTARGSARTCS